jgi:hypothetical protein
MAEAILSADRCFDEALSPGIGEQPLFFSKEGLSVNERTQDVGSAFSDVIVLKGAGPTIKEWYEGFEELRSIPHAFALAFANDETPIMFFSDSALEKVWS